MTSAIRPATASRCTRTAAPCGATDVTVPGHRLRAEPCGLPDGEGHRRRREAGADLARAPVCWRPARCRRRSRIVGAAAGAAQHVEPDQPGDVVGGRPLRDLGGGAVLRDPAVVEDQHPVGHASSRRAASWVTSTATPSKSARCRAQLEPQRHRDPDVEGGQRLVEQQQPGLGGQRPGDRDPLRLAAGQLRGPAVGRGRSTPSRASQSRGRPLGVPAGGSAAARAERDVVQRAQVREQQVAPGRPSRRRGAGPRRPARRRAVPGLAVADDPALVERHEPGERPQQRGLARRRWGRCTATTSPRSARQVYVERVRGPADDHVRRRGRRHARTGPCTAWSNHRSRSRASTATETSIRITLSTSAASWSLCSAT